MTTFEVILILWYAIGATLAYGLLMGSWIVEKGEKHGVSRGHILGILLYSSSSWFFALFWLWIALVGNKKIVLCWNMGRAYPADPKLKQHYIDKYGEIK